MREAGGPARALLGLWRSEKWLRGAIGGEAVIVGRELTGKGGRRQEADMG